MGNTPARKITPGNGVFYARKYGKKHEQNERKTAMGGLMGGQMGGQKRIKTTSEQTTYMQKNS